MPWMAPWSGRAAAALLLWTGLWIASRARFRDKVDWPRCPDCWYDMRGTSGRRCPECGFQASHRRHLFQSRRRLGLVLIGLGVALALPLLVIVRHTWNNGPEYWLQWGPGYLLFPREHVRTDRAGPFRLEYYRDRRSGKGWYVVIRPGRIKLNSDGSWLLSWYHYGDNRDVTGNGWPNLIMSRYAFGDRSEFCLLEYRDGKTILLQHDKGTVGYMAGDGV